MNPIEWKKTNKKKRNGTSQFKKKKLRADV
jgi:hypothetical protein